MWGTEGSRGVVPGAQKNRRSAREVNKGHNPLTAKKTQNLCPKR